MNIGFDAKRLYNNFTGLGNHSRTTIDILTEYFPENAYFLYTPKVPGLPKGAGTGTDSRVAAYLNKEHCATVLPHGMLGGSLWRTFGIPGELKRDGIDIFHGLSNELPVGIRRTGVPSVVTIHDVAFHTFPDMYHWQDRQIYDMKWRYAIKNADRIIAISECTKRDILRFYDVDENKIDVVYQPVGRRYYGQVQGGSEEGRVKSEESGYESEKLKVKSEKSEDVSEELEGVNEELRIKNEESSQNEELRIKNEESQGKNNSSLFTLHSSLKEDSSLFTLHSSLTPETGVYLLYVGSINSRKNLLGIVKAIEQLPKDLQIPLVVVGGGREYKVEVQRYIAEHHLEHLVIFPGHRVSDDELMELYRHARAFVYPSFYEGFGLPVVEAELCGCPVVTSNVSSLPEAGGPFSLQADPSSIEDIRDKIMIAITDDEQRNRMIRGGYEYAMNTFHPKVLAGKLMGTYKKTFP